MVEPPAPSRLVLPPELEGAERQLDVAALAAVHETDNAGLAARARTRVARAPGIEQRDARAGAAEVECRPPAESPRADDRDVSRHATAAQALMAQALTAQALTAQALTT